MNTNEKRLTLFGVIGVLSLIAPWVLPTFQFQLALLWMMVIFALTWDIVGGQMGYNSFGNIVFFGIGMYATAVVQRNLHFSVEEYVHVAGRVESLSATQYLEGLFLGMGVGVLLAVVIAAFLGACILAMGMRGQYFGICTLGLGVAAGELASGWEYIGAGSGLVTPVFPDKLGERGLFFYYLFFVLALAAFIILRWIYSGRFGLAINAIRDDEDKAEAMGIHTTRYKITAWCISAFFLSLAGGAAGHMFGFIDPTDVAFAGPTFGVWMILMAILGGKGTLWGPVIGAMIFHITQEFFWSSPWLFGWQRVALGVIIVAIVVFFPMGLIGWMRERWPERFGERVDQSRVAEVSEGSGT
ncbi:MAG: branched-chain amino acid ABC transporter permease [Deltaproteobacteria bacterium]|jgi:branched-chain amino acid transport system permease protein|nr:branched-chain amino acid ABC transporter permease [Deltaproteobacteria bacterium]